MILFKKNIYNIVVYYSNDVCYNILIGGTMLFCKLKKLCSRLINLNGSLLNILWLQYNGVICLRFFLINMVYIYIWYIIYFIHYQPLGFYTGNTIVINVLIQMKII